jgi:hypothetical protein
VRNCLLMKKAYGTNRNVGEQKHWQILYENDTKRRIQQALFLILYFDFNYIHVWNIVRVNIGFFTGFKKIKQRRISFVLGYLRMILWKISTAISIKHRILTTFNSKKKINSHIDEENTWHKSNRGLTQKDGIQQAFCKN